MSRKALSALVAQKLTNCKARVAENQAAGKHEDALQTLDTYTTYFTGAEDALKAIGHPVEDLKPIDVAKSVIEADRGLAELLAEDA